MTDTTEPRAVPRSVDLAARVTTLLARSFPEDVLGGQSGFRVLSHDVHEPRRMFVRWYGNGRLPADFKARAAELAAVLGDGGFAVTLVPDGWDVYVADRPADDSGPRYAAVLSDLPFGDRWLVMDQWTRVHAAVTESEEKAQAEAARLDRAQTLADARASSVPVLGGFLERADELMGDGMWWLRQEVHDVTRYGEITRHERIDALVDIAKALRHGREVEREGRMVAYKTPYPIRPYPAQTYTVQWIAKSTTAAVGYFPNPEWLRGPAEDAAIALLIEGGLHPVKYGEPYGQGMYMCEQHGFMVSATDPHDLSVPGVKLDNVGTTYAEELERAPEVLRAAGWRVTADTSWPGAWWAFPPAG